MERCDSRPHKGTYAVESTDHVTIRDALHGFVTGAGAVIRREVTKQRQDVSGG